MTEPVMGARLKKYRVGVHSGVLRLAFEKECEACHKAIELGRARVDSGQAWTASGRLAKRAARMSGLGGSAHRRARQAAMAHRHGLAKTRKTGRTEIAFRISAARVSDVLKLVSRNGANGGRATFQGSRLLIVLCEAT